MADIRAEILAASRSCTGWMEGYNQGSEHQPFINKVKSTFEGKIQENLEKSSTSSTKSEPVRRLGTKVSTIANLFQSLSPQKGDSSAYGSKFGNIHPVPSRNQDKQSESKGCERMPDPDSVERHAITDQNGTSNSESYLIRFNTAKAMFERLEEENRKTSGTLRQDSSSSQSSGFSNYSSSHNLSHGPSKSAFPANLPNTHVRHFETYADSKAQDSASEDENFCGKQYIDKLHDIKGSSASLDELSSADFNEESMNEDKIIDTTCRRKSHSKLIGISKESPGLRSWDEDHFSDSEIFQLDCNRNTKCDERSIIPHYSHTLKRQKEDYSQNELPFTDKNELVHSVAVAKSQRFTESCNSNEQISSNASSSSSFHYDVDYESFDIPSSLHNAASSNLLRYVSESSGSPEINHMKDPSSGNVCLDYLPVDSQETHMEDNNQIPYEVTVKSCQQVLYQSSDFNKYITEAVGSDFEKSDSGIDSAIIDSEYEVDELLRVTGDSIEILCHDQNNYFTTISSYKDDHRSHSLIPYSSTSDTTNAFTLKDPIQMKKNLSDKITLSSEAVVNYDKNAVSLMSDWVDLGLADSRRWSSSASPEHTVDQDSESESPCDAVDGLRDSAGETLAEFECRENELFFVEAVLDSEDQSSESGRFPSLQLSEASDFMTQEEAEKLLESSIRQNILNEEDTHDESILSHHGESNDDNLEIWKAPMSVNEEDDLSQGEADCDIMFPPGTNILYEDTKYHILPGGHFVTELPGLEDDSEDDESIMLCPIAPRKKTKVKFTTEPIKMYSTYSVEEYDRRNEEVDPVAASAEYELEKRIEKMDVFPVELMKGPEGLGLSIIGMGVGADAGLEKLGIFVKSVTEGGAAYRDNRIHVNDQIIEVDGKSLVGVTQAYAASVLRNTSGLVRFLIGRERDSTNSEIAHLISQSLQTEKEHQSYGQQNESPRKDLQLPLCSYKEDHRLDSCDSSHLSQGSTPEEGEDAPTVEVFDLTSGSSGSLSPDTDMETLRVKLKEAQYRNAVTEAELRHLKEKLQSLENVEAESQKYVQQLADANAQAKEKEILLDAAQKEAKEWKENVDKMKEELINLERKYNKAKKIIREFQSREKEFLQQEEYHLQQLQEKDQEYNALVKTLKDRIILLEHTLTETQKAENLPLQLPGDNIKQFTPQTMIKFHKTIVNKPALKQIEVDMSDGEFSDSDLSKCDVSPYTEGGEEYRKKSLREENFSQMQPLPDLLEASAGIAFNEDDRSGSISPQPIFSPTDSKMINQDTVMENISVLKSSDVPTLQQFHQSSNSSLSNIPHLGTTDRNLVGPESPLPSGPSFWNINSKPLTFAEEIKVAVLEWQTKVTSPVDDVNSVKEDVRMKQEETFQSMETSVESLSPSIQERPYHIEDSAYINSRSLVKISQDVNSATSNVMMHQTGPPLTGSKSKSNNTEPVLSNIHVNMQGGRQYQNMSSSLPKSKSDHRDPAKDGKVIFSTSTKSSKIGGGASQTDGLRSSGGDRYSHHWQGRPVHLWTTVQVGQWLMALGLQHHIRLFQEEDVAGQQLLHLDSSRLKALGVVSSSDRSTLKKKIKELKSQLEKERKAHEKEQKARERQQKKAEKASKKK